MLGSVGIVVEKVNVTVRVTTTVGINVDVKTVSVLLGHVFGTCVREIVETLEGKSGNM